jgi:hypothetical protein
LATPADGQVSEKADIHAEFLHTPIGNSRRFVERRFASCASLPPWQLVRCSQRVKKEDTLVREGRVAKDDAAALLSFLLCDKVRQLTEQPRRD